MTLDSTIMKVNHAGEHGAVNIYAGQIWVARWLRPDCVAQLDEFRTHEIEHRRIFAEVLNSYNIPRCASYHLCGVGGFCLGVFSALLGQQAIFATTVAVESVVLAHLDGQRMVLKEPMAWRAVESIVCDEQHHHDAAQHQLTSQHIGLSVLMKSVGAVTEAVIWLGMRL